MGRKTDKIHGIWKRLAVVVAAILTAYCFYTIAQVERQPLMENEGDRKSVV